MKGLIVGISILLLVVSSTICTAQTDGGAHSVLTLEECVKIALEQNYSIKIAKNREQIAANNVTYAPFLPTVALSGRQNSDLLDTHTKYKDSSTPDLKQSNDPTLLNAELGLSWRLFDGMGMFATYQTQKELLSQGELNLRLSIESLITDIAQQYYYIVTQEGRMKAARRYLEISMLRYNQAMEKYVIGSISGLEMKQAKIDLNADSSKLVTQREVINNAYIQLYQVMNAPLDSKMIVVDTITPNGGLDLGQLIGSAKSKNASILMAERGEKISELDLKIARSRKYPTLNFNASYRFNHTLNSNVSTKYYQNYGPSLGFTVSAPLFSGFENNRKIKNAAIELDNSSLVAKNTELDVISNISQLYNNYRNNFLMIGFEKESAEAAMLNLEAAMEMYRLGTMSGVQFREIQRSYLEAEERKLSALYQAKSSELSLIYLAGEAIH